MSIIFPYFLSKELSKNLNTDEAAALGAVYQSASLSKQFKVSKFLVKDSTVYPIQVLWHLVVLNIHLSLTAGVIC